MSERVILVDLDDHALKSTDKHDAHRKGTLHRAFSVFIFNSNGELLLQKRAAEKYHSGGLWANTCCGHPKQGEDVKNAATRRLQEEMGMNVTLKTTGTVTYHVHVGNNMTEHEFDYLLTGTSNDEPRPDSKEVSEWKWMAVDELKKQLRQSPRQFAAWLPPTLEKVRP